MQLVGVYPQSAFQVHWHPCSNLILIDHVSRWLWIGRRQLMPGTLISGHSRLNHKSSHEPSFVDQILWLKNLLYLYLYPGLFVLIYLFSSPNGIGCTHISAARTASRWPYMDSISISDYQSKRNNFISALFRCAMMQDATQGTCLLSSML